MSFDDTYKLADLLRDLMVLIERQRNIKYLLEVAERRNKKIGNLHYPNYTVWMKLVETYLREKNLKFEWDTSGVLRALYEINEQIYKDLLKGIDL